MANDIRVIIDRYPPQRPGTVALENADTAMLELLATSGNEEAMSILNKRKSRDQT